MREQLARTCDTHDQAHGDPYACPDVVVVRMADGRIGLPVHDGGRSAILIDYCPWCAARLPEIRR